MSIDVIISRSPYAEAWPVLERALDRDQTVTPSAELARLIETLRHEVSPAVFSVDPGEQVFDPDGVLLTTTTHSLDDLELIVATAHRSGYRVYDPDGHEF